MIPFDRDQPDPFKQQVRRSFDATTASYGTNGDVHWQFARRLIDRAPLQPDQIVLDVTTGTAPAAIMAARIVGSGGRVMGVDLAPGILRLAQRNIVPARTDTIDLIGGNAEYLPFADNSFDVIVCSSAIVWFPAIDRALSEWRRVLCPGGAIAFSCFGGPARQTINDLIRRLLAPYGVGFPELNTPLNTPEKCRAIVQAAGFRNVRIAIDREQQFTLDPDTSFS